MSWLLIVAPLSTSQPIRRAVSQQANPPINSRFGAVESYYRPDEAAALGIGWERIIFEWRLFQPDSPDQWNTDQIPDSWLATAAASGREVIGLVKNAPHWATGSPLLGAPALGLDKPIDDPANTFGTFMTRLVREYSQKWHIHHWIIYNEPDIQPSDTNFFEFAGTAEDYYHVLKVAYLAAHQADPQAIIHFAGTTWWEDESHKRPQFIARVLQIASQDPAAKLNGLFFDVLTIHVYDRTELVWQMVNELGGLTVAAGFPKEIWIDELNAHPTEDVDWSISNPYIEVRLSQQADFLIQATALAMAAGAQRVGVYRLYDNVSDVLAGTSNAAWGLIRNDGTHRPAYKAWRTVIKEFANTTTVGRVDHDPQSPVTIIALHEIDRTLIVAWSKSGASIPLTVVDQPGITAVDVNDKPVPLTYYDGLDRVTLEPCYKPCSIEGSPILISIPDPSIEPESVLGFIDQYGHRQPINAASRSTTPPRKPLSASPTEAATPVDAP